MKKVILKNFKHESRTIEQLDVFVHDDDSLILLPSLYSLFLYYHLSHYKQIDKKLKNGKNQTQLVQKDISEVTAEQYVSHLDRFLRYLHQSDQEKPNQNWLMLNHNLPPDIINFYINDIFIERDKGSSTAATQCVSALTSYYNYLVKVGLTQTYKSLRILPGNKAIAQQNTKRRKAIKYIPQSTRNALIRQCTNLRDKLILRCGAEIGTRAKEVTGFYLKDFEYGQKTRKGLLTLFNEMDDNPDETVFTYYLPGKNSKGKPGKGGESRDLYIEVDLLKKMQDYYLQERPNSECNTFFLKVDTRGYGEPIPNNQASNVFRKMKNKLLKMQEQDNSLTYKIEEDHVYHIMRHSFGTDKFYEYSLDTGTEIDAITASSSVMIQIAELMGHSLAGKDKGLKVTQDYIRSTRQKMTMEGLK